MTEEPPFAASVCVASAVVLGAALQVADGCLHDRAIVYLLVALVAMFAAVALGPPFAMRRITNARLFDVVCVLGLTWSCYGVMFKRPGIYLVKHPLIQIHHAFALSLFFGAAFLFLNRGQGLKLCAAAVGIGVTGMAVWMLVRSPKPFIDVWYWQEHSMALLGRGENPWAATMPNLYGTSNLFAPGSTDGNVVFTGYPYPPLTLLCGLPGHLLLGDYRWAYAVLLIGAAALCFFARPSHGTLLLAALFLGSPRMLFVLEQGWSEVPGIFFLGLLVFVWQRRPRLLPYVFGLLLASKQYFVFVAPLALLFLPDERRNLRGALSFGAKAMAVVALFTLPALLWNASALFGSLVTFQARQPFRPDALSVMAWTARDGVPILPGWPSWLSVLATWLYAYKKAPRSMFGFLSCSALTLALFFALSKQAFCNYYFLVVGALFMAAAAATMPSKDPQPAI